MKVRVYYTNHLETFVDWETISLFKLVWWLLIKRIYPKGVSDVCYITKIETIYGKRI